MSRVRDVFVVVLRVTIALLGLVATQIAIPSMSRAEEKAVGERWVGTIHLYRNELAIYTYKPPRDILNIREEPVSTGNEWEDDEVTIWKDGTAWQRRSYHSDRQPADHGLAGFGSVNKGTWEGPVRAVVQVELRKDGSCKVTLKTTPLSKPKPWVKLDKNKVEHREHRLLPQKSASNLDRPVDIDYTWEEKTRRYHPNGSPFLGTAADTAVAISGPLKITGPTDVYRWGRDLGAGPRGHWGPPTHPHGHGPGNYPLWTSTGSNTVKVRWELTRVKANPVVLTTIELQNRLLPKDKVAATGRIEIFPAGEYQLPLVGGQLPLRWGTTTRGGQVMLSTGSLEDGSYILRVTPTTGNLPDPRVLVLTDTELNNIRRKAGVMPQRIFRPLDVSITIKEGQVQTATVDPSAKGEAVLGAKSRLTIKLQPMWMESPNQSSRGNNGITLIVIHHTDGTVISGSLTTFLNPHPPPPEQPRAAHYVINKDGEIVKMVKDREAAWHAGYSYWGGQKDVKTFSIGIEIVNKDRSYTEEQYTALLKLLEHLQTEFQLDRSRIVGHSDIAYEKTTLVLGRKGYNHDPKKRDPGDPGLEFEWTRLERHGLGLIPKSGPFPATIYGGFFNLAPQGSLCEKDSDALRRFGGRKWPRPPASTPPPPTPGAGAPVPTKGRPASAAAPTVVGEPIKELQQDLSDIGYLVDVNGKFDLKTEEAVEMFQEHFFTGTRRRPTNPNGRVDKATAELIKSVRP